MGKKKYNYEIVKEYIESFNYELLSDKYESVTKKLLVKCDKGHEYKTTFSNFTSGRRCPHCAGQKIDYKTIKNYIESQGYELISKEIKNRKQKILIKCPEGHITEVVWDNFKRGNRCRVCAREKQKLKYEDVKFYIESFGYKLLSKEYVNNQTKLLVVCPKGHEYEVTFGNFQEGKRCPICAKNQRLEYEDVKQYIEKYNYKLLSKEYKNNRTPLEIECEKGHIFKCSFDNFKKGNRCPKCKSAKGQIKIKDILIKHNINFKEEYKFKNCKFKRSLPFDFYLPDYNCCIEFDGVQHYKINEYFGGYEGFVDRKIRDTVKNIYCKDNDIKLIRIPYKDMNNLENIILNKIINE